MYLFTLNKNTIGILLTKESFGGGGYCSLLLQFSRGSSWRLSGFLFSWLLGYNCYSRILKDN